MLSYIYDKLHDCKEKTKNIIKILILIILLFVLGFTVTKTGLIPNWF